MVISKENLGGLLLFLVVVAIAFGWTAGKSNADEGLEQRISGLEARVTILESELQELTSNGPHTTEASQNFTIDVFVSAKPNTTDGVGLWDEETGVCYISHSFHTGSIISAHDENGMLIGTAEFITPESSVPTKKFVDSCVFEATLTVSEFSFITFKVGDLETDPYSFEQLEDDDWSVSFSSRS